MILNYEGSCFLADVKDICAGSKCHVSLQKQLINDVLKRKSTGTINNIDGGINLITKRISSLKVLVVLDDIDHRNQVDYLVRNFITGSVIILTTRNEDLLETLGVKARYRVNVLGSVQSWQLFKRHAFGDTEIREEFMEMSEEILHHAGGLPLALTVLGSSLKNKSKNVWRCFIEELLQFPVHDVQKSLRISFDVLKLVNPKLQAFFLDIACFFIGQLKEYAVKILETCYKFANQYIIMLKERCFITINENNQLSMHNLLSGMGRKIAGNSRLFLQEDIQDVLLNNKGTEAIEGMVDRDYRSAYDWDYRNAYDWDYRISYSIDGETFNTMPNVRFLRLCYTKDIRGSFGKPFKELRWLCWYGCDSFPSNFCADKLVFLELRCNSISRIEEKALVLGNLKILRMSWSERLSKTPHFNGLPCLETLNLSSCSSLVEVDVSIGNLERLATLDLSACTSLTSLPHSICKLRALECLTLTGCSSLKALPMDLGNIESLTNLYAGDLGIFQLPDSLGRLRKLLMMDLSDNSSLQSIPKSICNLTSLESLYLTGCSSLIALPMALWNIESLTHFDADGLSICQLQDSLGLIIVLEADELDFEAYDCLQSIRNMRSVESLNISCCDSTQLANLQLPSTLKELKAYNCMSLPNLSNLQQLEKMNLSGCSSLTEINGLEKLVSIKELHLDQCQSVKGLPNLSNLQQLEILYFSDCSSLTEIEGLEKLVSVKEILIVNCRSLKRLPNLSDWKKLKTLQLYGCSSLTEIQGLGEVVTLRKLDLRGCISLKRLPNLSNLQQLHTLQVRDCTSLTDIQGLKKISSITILYLEGCTLSPDLSSLQLMEGPDISLQLNKRLPDLSRLQAVLDLNAEDLDSSGYRDNISSDNEDGAKSDGDVSTELHLGWSKISGVNPTKKLKLNNGNASTSGSKKNIYFL